MSSGMRGGNGSFPSEKNRTSKDSPIQTKTPTTTVTPSTPASLGLASSTESPATSRTLFVQAATAKQITTVTSLITSTTILTTKFAAKHAVGATQGNLTLSCQTTVTAENSEHRLKSSSREDLKTLAKNSPKNIHQTASQISPFTDLPKSLKKTTVLITGTDSPKSLQRATLSQIPMSSPKLRSNPTTSIAVDRADTFQKGSSKEMAPSLSPKLKSNDDGAWKTCWTVKENSQGVESMQPLGTKHSKVEILQRHNEEEKVSNKNRERKGREDILKDMQVGCTLKGIDLTLVASKCPLSPLDRKQLSPGVTTASTSQVKKTAGKTDKNGMAQERECDREKRKKEERGREGQEKECLEEKVKEKREVERGEAQIKKEGQKGKYKEKETEERKGNEREGEDRKSKAMERESKESEREESRREKKVGQISKSFKYAATMTEEVPVPVHTLDDGLQTELLHVDTEVQAVVEVSNKSTTISPNLTHRSRSQMDPNLKLPFDLNSHEKVSETACTILQNGLSHDASSDFVPPDWLSPVGSKPKCLAPPPYKSPICYKPTQQHVCQIEIELRSQPFQSDNLAMPDVTVTEEKDSKASSIGSGLEREPKHVEREGDKAETGPPPEVAWDEKGMTWEVYGAAVDMESLGFAIQNHLQRKIQEHEWRIGHLRKSISLSEHSRGDEKGAKKKKRNVFRSLFQRPTCCLKTQAET